MGPAKPAQMPPGPAPAMAKTPAEPGVPPKGRGLMDDLA